MKLQTIQLQNFRQFYGEQTPIKFSDTTEENVTMIFGANGSGKTALLNAFTWVLYNETTPALETPDNLVCERAIVESEVGDEVKAAVTLEFEHNGKIYSATRERIEEKTDDPLQTRLIINGELDLKITDTDGQTKIVDNPSPRLDKVLPERLHKFFFFDGERIEELAKESAYQEVENAIKNILGLTILERAINHLGGKVKRTLDNRLSEAGTTEITEIIEKIQEVEDTIQKKENELERIEKNKAANEDNLDEVKQRLRELDETKDLQEKIDNFEEREQQIQKSISAKKDKLKNELSRNGYSAFIKPLIDQSCDILKDKRRKGEIPSGIKKQFVNDLLDEESCICGSNLKPGSEKRQNVKNWLNKAGMSEIEQEAIKVGMRLQGLSERRENFYESIQQLQAEINDKEELLREVREQIDEIDHKLSERDSEEIQELVARREELEREIEKNQKDIGRIEQTLEDKEEEINKLEEKKEEAEADNKLAKKFQRQLNACKEAHDFFEKLYEQKSQDIRQELDQKVKSIYQSISYKNYWPEITKNYRLVLKKGIEKSDEEVRKDVAKSTGENQVLSLSFISSIVHFAKSLTENSSDSLIDFSGGIYPIVMDSPFGTLDDNYREAVADGIPELAEQIVIIASKSQGKGKVLRNLRSRIDRAYVLSYFTPNDEYDEESIDIEGNHHNYISHSKNNQEWAEIQEIT